MSDDPPIIEFKPTGAIVCPGLSFEEWQERWNGIDATSRSINFLVGDMLAYGEDCFPEWSQVLDAQYAEAHRGAMRVSRRIPITHRREEISWSAHREAAAVETLEERIELLDLAEANGWGSREIAAEVRRRREARQHNGPPLPEALVDAILGIPIEVIEAEDEGRSTWNEDPTPTVPAAIDSNPLPVPLAGPTEAPTEPAPPDTPVTPETIRAAIAAVRRVSNEIALGTALPSTVEQAETMVYAVLRDAFVLGALTDHERAVSLLPPPWKGRVVIEFGEHVFGGRTYAVTLVRPGGKQMAAGLAPTLACAIVDSALAALLSDMGAY